MLAAFPAHLERAPAGGRFLWVPDVKACRRLIGVHPGGRAPECPGPVEKQALAPVL